MTMDTNLRFKTEEATEEKHGLRYTNSRHQNLQYRVQTMSLGQDPTVLMHRCGSSIYCIWLRCIFPFLDLPARGAGYAKHSH